jgi:glycosyltransferase involved in cell wall biosynthesis
VRSLPSVVYFHENQLTYPARTNQERDLHFGFTNFTTAVAASRVWYNSAFHRDTFLDALEQLLGSMPDYNCLDWVSKVSRKSDVYPQGIQRVPHRGARRPGPARLVWVARWEFDKNPEMFFEALFALQERSLPFRVSVLGERFAECPAIFDIARKRLRDHLDRWGYQESREEYIRALLDADLVVSTADHEFFGVGVVEAVAAGCFPLLPRRLAYPELFGPDRVEGGNDFFYGGSLDSLVDRLTELLPLVERGELWGGRPERGVRAVEPYVWDNLAPRLDEALDRIR